VAGILLTRPQGRGRKGQCSSGQKNRELTRGWGAEASVGEQTLRGLSVPSEHKGQVNRGHDERTKNAGLGKLLVNTRPPTVRVNYLKIPTFPSGDSGQDSQRLIFGGVGGEGLTDPSANEKSVCSSGS